MSNETKIASTLASNPAAVLTSAAVSYVACTDYPYALVPMLDWKLGRWILAVGVVVALWFTRRRRSRELARARVIVGR